MNKISGIRHVTFSGSMGLDGIPRIEAHHTFSETKNPALLLRLIFYSILSYLSI